MILKKPYAFLIKYFRFIHLILAAPLIYLLIRTGKIVGFFGDYVSSGYYTSMANVPGEFVNYFMYIGVLIILLSGIAIYFLMRQKEKSTKFYFFLILFYLVLFIVFGVSHSILGSMEANTIEATAARAYRDLSYLFYLPQFFFTAFALFRGVGFDLKKFNFETDLKELEITDVDSEEFELNINIEDYKIKRNLRRFVREFKYYVLENKFIFGILCSVFIVIFGTIIYLNVEVYHKTYKVSQTVTHNNLNIKFMGSMLTNRDYSGAVFKNNQYYLVVKINIENKSKKVQTLDANNFFIELENRRVYPTLDKAEYFIDYALPIKQETELALASNNTYVLAYELTEQEQMADYTLKILEQTTFTVGEITPQYKTVKLSPYKATEIETVESFNFGKIASFEESNIGFTTLQMKEVIRADSYLYQYEHCYENGSCRQLSDKVVPQEAGRTLLILKADYFLDNTTLYYKAARTDRLFASHFLSLKANNQLIQIKNRTPAEFKEGFILEIPSNISTSDLALLVTIRDKRYILNLK